VVRIPRAAAQEPVAFNESTVSSAPTTSGVYFLYREARLIYIGIAVHGTGIRQQLEKHLSGAYGERTRAATAFRFEETRDPVVASREYLLEHMAEHRGRPPLCNRVSPLEAGSP
jgi:hypothetical protein